LAIGRAACSRFLLSLPAAIIHFAFVNAHGRIAVGFLAG
jgi:hypothetical protein